MVQPPMERKMNSVDLDSASDKGCATCLHCKRSVVNSNDVDNGLLLRELEQSQQEVLALRREVQQLRPELVEARSGISTSLAQNEWCDYQLDRNSEVYCSSFAASAWATEGHEGVRLFINQNNILTELKSTASFAPNPDAMSIWNRGFVSPIPLMPKSAIAAVNSFWSKNRVPDSEPTCDRGRNIQRVFYFDVHGILREWVCQGPVWWQTTSLAIPNADPKCISAMPWAEGGYAVWSLFYMTKEEVIDGEWRGGRLLETRCVGGATSKRSKATDVGWSREHRRIEGLSDNQYPPVLALHSSFSVTTNRDGTDRQIFYLDPSGSEPNPPFKVLKWGGKTQNGWVTPPPPNGSVLYAPPDKPTCHFSALNIRDGKAGIRIQLKDKNILKEWSSNPSVENGRWTMQEVCSNNPAPQEMVASVDLQKGDQYRRLIFSLSEGRVTQAVLFPDAGWSVKPIIIGRI